MAGTGRRWRWGYLACAWALAFAAAHFYWALGGRVGLDVSAGPALATGRPLWFVVVGLFGVGAALLVGAGLAVLLERAARWWRPLSLLGWAAGGILLVRGVGVELLLALGVVRAGDGITQAQIAWTWALWNPWFVVGGVCFTLATAAFSRRLSGSNTGVVPGHIDNAGAMSHSRGVDADSGMG